MKVFLIILAILLLLGFLPLGGVATYCAEGLEVKLRIGPFRLRVYPPKPSEGKPKKVKKKDKPEEAEKSSPLPKGGRLSLVRELLPLVPETLGKLKRRLTIDTLRIQVTWGGSNPADTALGFGCANAALGILWSVLRENFKIKRHQLGCDVDFDAPAPTVYLQAGLSMTLGGLLLIGVPLLLRFLLLFLRWKKAHPQPSPGQPGQGGPPAGDKPSPPSAAGDKTEPPVSQTMKKEA